MADLPRPAARRRIPLRRLALVVAVAVVLAGGALLLAGALDSPAGASARDEAQAVAPGTSVSPGQGLGQLPPLALVLDHVLPEGIAGLPTAQQARRLRARAAAAPGAARSVELGSVLQLLGDVAGAEAAYRDALARDPGDIGAQVGLALAGGSGTGGLGGAAARLRALSLAHPDDPLVAFNQGWVELYRRRAAPAIAAWRRTIAIAPGSRLGRTAAALLDTLGNGSGGRNP